MITLAEMHNLFTDPLMGALLVAVLCIQLAQMVIRAWLDKRHGDHSRQVQCPTDGCIELKQLLHDWQRWEREAEQMRRTMYGNGTDGMVARMNQNTRAIERIERKLDDLLHANQNTGSHPPLPQDPKQ